MAKKTRPPAWYLTIHYTARILFFRYLEVFQPKDRNESKDHAYLMTLWEGDDDLSKPTPALDAAMVANLAEILRRFEVTDELVEGLAADLKRIPPDENSKVTLMLAREDVKFILTVYDKVVGNPEIAKNNPHLIRGVITRQLIPYVEAFEAASKDNPEATEGILEPVKSEEEKKPEAKEEEPRGLPEAMAS